MTPDPTRDTPPPAPRPTLRDPPPAPRKLRGVRKTRRRRPRSDDLDTPSPACTVCQRRRPLRASGLCWSLACALKMAQDDETQSVQRTTQNAEQVTDEDCEMTSSQRIKRDDTTADAEAQSVRRQSTDAVPVDPVLTRHQLQFSQGSDDIHADEDADRGSLVEDIERQDKDVDRSESDDREDEAT